MNMPWSIRIQAIGGEIKDNSKIILYSASLLHPFMIENTIASITARRKTSVENIEISEHNSNAESLNIPIVVGIS